jgi:hypothetical protein
LVLHLDFASGDLATGLRLARTLDNDLCLLPFLGRTAFSLALALGTLDARSSHRAGDRRFGDAHFAEKFVRRVEIKLGVCSGGR